MHTFPWWDQFGIPKRRYNRNLYTYNGSIVFMKQQIYIKINGQRNENRPRVPFEKKTKVIFRIFLVDERATAEEEKDEWI